MSSAVATRRAALAALALTMLASACGDEVVTPAPDADAEGVELESGRLGHVSVIVQPREDELGPAPAVSVEARFAEFRALDPEAARRRANIPRDPAAGLSVGTCAPSNRLGELTGEADPERELTLVDGGDLRVEIGGLDVAVPLALVPDLVPWVAGVEYVHVGEDATGITSTPDGLVPVVIRLEGSSDDGLGSIDLTLDLPHRFELLPAVEIPTEDAAGALHLRWQPPGASTDLMVLQLGSFSEVTMVGDDVTCVVWDSGEARLDMSTLREAGLGDTDLIRVTARRLVRTEVDAGAFEDVEVMIEMRDQLFVPAP